MKVGNNQFTDIVTKIFNKKKGLWSYEVKSIWPNIVKDIVNDEEAIPIGTKKTDSGFVLKVACMHGVVTCVVDEAKKIIIERINKNIGVIFIDVFCVTNTRYFIS
ncbi:hypothetical protein CAXC1_190009 [Candidatus Xenohaliotis californiensis]|uniref:DUF721 domain-containing protein n=1 Tax=Candidatus Xenohaliotis californiensis TaxID=84677 RepID=A0ABM9N7K5_9RICK|nr:hypothetical protein CAXC1_190009 [Candidatus Xenohaliotis californiensis]